MINAQSVFRITSIIANNLFLRYTSHSNKSPGQQLFKYQVWDIIHTPKFSILPDIWYFHPKLVCALSCLGVHNNNKEPNHLVLGSVLKLFDCIRLWMSSGNIRKRQLLQMSVSLQLFSSSVVCFFLHLS